MTTDSANSLQATTLTPVAYVRSCFTERFGIPRQAGLVKSATASIVFANSESNMLSLRGIEDFSHLWVIFLLHKQHYKNPKALVSPPRLGGSKRVGVFATRSPNRPNPVGLSAVRLESIEQGSQQILLHIRGADLLDGTPVLDIKPYVPFVDSIEQANGAWAEHIETPMPVTWSEPARNCLRRLHGESTDKAGEPGSTLQQLIEETIALDPRPAHERIKDGEAGQSWGMKISDVNVRWQVDNGIALIIKLEKLPVNIYE
ncbi:tRNA (N6-threonylcarbamoyladenosine(37)-N6)-methyltransferase TrmO [Chromatiales bacterium (ex Bugula neritina AB1)]|nr:tRNA (N6-threonylcarbamoyladenosine(37)-N6)-methyltransferase TrmO [Chromatiales bacterium (ex Bugula neritina AB1)]